MQTCALFFLGEFTCHSALRCVYLDFCPEMIAPGLLCWGQHIWTWSDYICSSGLIWLHLYFFSDVITHVYITFVLMTWWHLDFLYWLYFDIYTGLRTNNSPHYICSSVYPELISSGPRHWGDCNCHSVMRWTRLDVGMWWLILYRVLQNAEMIITWPLW